MVRSEASLNLFGFSLIFWRLMVVVQLIRPLCWAAGPFCYGNDHNEERGDEACNPSADVSMCCGKGWACLGNGLCRSTRIPYLSIGPGLDYSGSCTDSQWGSNICINPCGSGNEIIQCDNNTYCCLPCSCDNKTSNFTLQGQPSPFTTIGVFASSAPGASSLSTSKLRPSTLSTSPTFSASPFSSSDPPSSTSSTLLPPPSTRKSPGSTNAIKMGVGVGVPAAALCLIAIAFLFFRRERHWKKGMQKMQARSVLPMLFSDNNPAQPDDFLSERVIPAHPHQLSGREIPAEVGGTPRNELP